MKYNFDKIVNRKNTNCFKHDATTHYFGKEDILPLWVADTDFEAPPFIQDALKKRAEHPVYGYTFFSDSFYASLIRWMQKRHNFHMDPSWITVTPGVVTGISTAILSLTEPGDKIIIQPPVYYPFFHLVESNRRKLILNNLKLENNRYEMDFDDLENCIDPDTKMIILSNPHNPVGRVWTRWELEKLAAICEKYNIIIIDDAIHCDIIYQPHRFVPMAEISEYASKNTITFVAPSKTFNLAGMITSAAIISQKELRDRFTEMIARLHFSTGSVFGTVAFEAAYTYGEVWLDQLLDYLSDNIRFVQMCFAEHLPQVKVVEPEGTYLLWLDFSELHMDDEHLNQILIEEAGVGLNRGISFGSNGKNYMRLNVGSPRKIIEKGIEQIISVLKDHIK